MTQMTTTEIAERIAERLDATLSALAEARAALKAVEQDELALMRALRALDPENSRVAPAPKPEKKSRPKPVGKKVSDDVVGRVLEVIQDAYPETVMVRDITEKLDVSKDAVAASLNILRKQGSVRLAGRAKSQGAPSLYALLNGDGHE